jgi:hypothetical protein
MEEKDGKCHTKLLFGNPEWRGALKEFTLK